jgi:hypothetical protein
MSFVLPTVEIATPDGVPVTLPCEPINDVLAITPVLGRGRFIGTFTITHRPTGREFTESGGCIDCCREAGRLLAEVAVDWSALTADNSLDWLMALPADAQAAVTKARAISCDQWHCGQDDES